MGSTATVISIGFWGVTVLLATLYDPAHAADVSMGAASLVFGGLIVASALNAVAKADRDAEESRRRTDEEGDHQMPKQIVEHFRIEG